MVLTWQTLNFAVGIAVAEHTIDFRIHVITTPEPVTTTSKQRTVRLPSAWHLTKTSTVVTVAYQNLEGAITPAIPDCKGISGRSSLSGAKTNMVTSAVRHSWAQLNEAGASRRALAVCRDLQPSSSTNAVETMGYRHETFGYQTTMGRALTSSEDAVLIESIRLFLEVAQNHSLHQYDKEYMHSVSFFDWS